MNNCLFCYKPVGNGMTYHPKCCKTFFGTDQLPEIKLDQEILTELGKQTANQRIAITGVQPKLSPDLNTSGLDNRLTIVGLWGKFILKPQNIAIDQMPEVEDLTMHLARIFKIKTCAHCLLPTTNGELVYLAKRFDRMGQTKIHMEDFCQLSGFQTEQKYDSSYERCGKLIKLYCNNNGLNSLNYFEILVFSFLSGNSDMHMKNFSLLYKDNEVNLSPAYDLINTHLVYPNDKEDMALLLSGKKAKLKLNAFINLANSLDISPTVFKRVIKKFIHGTEKVFALIDHSFLSEEYKSKYKSIWKERLFRLTS